MQSGAGKRVAISTLGERFLLSNYGTFFQHYALRKVLCGLGFSPFRLSQTSGRYEESGFLMVWLKDAVRPLYWLLKRIPEWRLNCKRIMEEDLQNLRFVLDYHRLIGRFREPQRFNDGMVGIMGGDQVLGTTSTRAWLGVLPQGCKRITYAASTDWTERERGPSWQNFAREQFKRFSAIGLRETVGVDFCRRLVKDGALVGHVADPVMLLTTHDYEMIADRRKIFHRLTLFCYLVNIRTAEDLMLAKYEELADRLGCELKILGIQGAERFIPARYKIRLRPSRFLRAMMDAQYIVTNSYHGSVFAAVLHKEFLSVHQNCLPGTNQNVRQQEFMSQFGLRDHWVDRRHSAKQWQDALAQSIDWNVVDGDIEAFRSSSLKWLARALADKI